MSNKQSKIAADAVALLPMLKKNFKTVRESEYADWQDLYIEELKTIIAALELLKPMQERIKELETFARQAGNTMRIFAGAAEALKDPAPIDDEVRG